MLSTKVYNNWENLSFSLPISLWTNFTMDHPVRNDVQDFASFLQTKICKNLVKILHICSENGPFLARYLQGSCTSCKIYKNLASQIPILQESYFMFGKWSFLCKALASPCTSFLTGQHH